MSYGRQLGYRGQHGALQSADGVDQQTHQMGSWNLSRHSEPQRWGNHYGSVNMTGGNLHQGDRYYLNAEDIIRKEAERFIDSLRFPDINLRVNQIAESHNTTFQWALDSDSSSYQQQSRMHSRPLPAQSGAFGDWLTTNDSLFWVAGKPGSGKSTLMKYLSSHNKTSALLRQTFHNQEVLILRFFFWLHGSEMQRTIKGCLCTLLYQLLCHDHELVTKTLQEDVSLRIKHHYNDWSESELRQILFGILSSEFRACAIFIDGLDEYDTQSDVRILLDLVRDLSMLRTVKICVSSRQENAFERAFLHNPKLRIQDLTFEDIRAMARVNIQTELDELGLCLTEIQVRYLASEVTWRAEGVFLWAILAIRATTESIRNYDDYEALLEGLQGLPNEFEDLCQRLLAKVNGSGLKAWETTLRYFTVAKYQPMSLLTFTLATDEQALWKIVNISTPPTHTDMEWLLQACVRTESKIRAHTAGLLEVIARYRNKPKRRKHAEPTDQHSSISKEGITEDGCPSEHSLCSCSDDGVFGACRCFALLPCSDELWEVDHKRVRYMHRHVAEVLESWNVPGLANSCETEVRLDSQRKFFLAQFFAQYLGCFCKDIPDSRRLCRVLTDLGQFHACAVVDQVNSTVRTRNPSTGGHHCDYGWTHYPFNSGGRCGRASLFGQDINPTDRAIYDFYGLLVRLGLPVFNSTGGAVPFWSSYYKGYLLACTLKGEYNHHSECRERYLGKSRVASWLLSHGADVVSPQLSYAAFGDLRLHQFDLPCLMLRPLIVDCWCFILRLLDEPQMSREEKLQICTTVVPAFLAQKCCLQDTTIWSVRCAVSTNQPNAVIHDDEAEGVWKLQFIMKTSIQKLQAYCLGAIWHLQEDHQHGR